MLHFFCHNCISERSDNEVSVDSVGEITCDICNQDAVERLSPPEKAPALSSIENCGLHDAQGQADSRASGTLTSPHDSDRRMPPELANMFHEAAHAPALNVEHLCATQLEPGVMAYNRNQNLFPDARSVPQGAVNVAIPPSHAHRSSDLLLGLPEIIGVIPAAEPSAVPERRIVVSSGASQREGNANANRRRLPHQSRTRAANARTGHSHSLAVHWNSHAPVFLPQRRNSRRHTHVGVTCDGCEAVNFLGLRYRCLVCRDYDLCERCFDGVDLMHPFNHTFEVLTQSAHGTDNIAQHHTSLRSLPVINIIMAFEEAPSAVTSGLSSEQVAWWLASPEVILEKTDDPTWACSICTDNEHVDESGWLVCICRQGDVKDADDSSNSTHTSQKGSHVFHSDCIRKWLLQDNSCPICRRTPIYTE